jgi:hypothetical protein
MLKIKRQKPPPRLQRMRHCLTDYVATGLACVTGMFKVLLDLFHDLHPDAHSMQMGIAEFSL